MAGPRYNFNGYEGCPSAELCRKYYGEYYNLVQTMAELGEATEPDLGCGRAMWENNSSTGSYGTTMALMLLPHWTDGCIASQEGLFFEASGTTPYHFLTVAAMSQSSSNPVRELRYTNTNAAVGVPMMQKMGIKYLMVFTSAAKDQADSRDDLELVATSGPWNIYRVIDSEVVVPLTVQPVVVNGRSGDQRERNLELGTSWFQNPDEWARAARRRRPFRLAAHRRASGSWTRRRSAPSRWRPRPQGGHRRACTRDIVVDPLPRDHRQQLRDGRPRRSASMCPQVGVPVLIKMSYFPNWQVDGAEGPYRVAPNFMVVIPAFEPACTCTTSHRTQDRFFYFLTLLGIGLLVLWRRRGDVRHRSVASVPDPAGRATGLGWSPTPCVRPRADVCRAVRGSGRTGRAMRTGHGRRTVRSVVRTTGLHDPFGRRSTRCRSRDDLTTMILRDGRVRLQ
jgi:hypothetical protein